MTGNAPDVGEFANIAREYDALLYIDDAHGFGVIGERAPDELCDYGTKGNGVVRHAGEHYDNTVVVAGLSKAYSSLAAFIACPTQLKEILKTAAPPYLYSGPSPIASLATALEGLKVNERRGDLLRQAIHRKTHRILDALAMMGIATPNTSGYPIIEIPLAKSDDLDEVGRHLFRRAAGDRRAAPATCAARRSNRPRRRTAVRRAHPRARRSRRRAHLRRRRPDRDEAADPARMIDRSLRPILRAMISAAA